MSGLADPGDGPAFPDGFPDTDPALASAVLEIETHAAAGGWDQAAGLYALVDTAALAAATPELAARMGLDDATAAGSLTPVQQEPLPPGAELEDVLPTIVWPPEVVGCAAVVERLVLPPDADPDLPVDRAAAIAFAQGHPRREEVRIVAGATRSGATYCALRLRGHDDDASVVGGRELVPELLRLLLASLDPDPDDQPDDRPHDQPDHPDPEDLP